MRFIEHGEYDLIPDGQIIFYKPYGAWNKEAALVAIADFERAIQLLADEPFAIVVDSSQLDGFTADSMHTWSQAIQYWYDRGHRAFVRVDDPNSPNYRIFLKRFDDTFEQKMAFTLCESHKDAFRWLNANGYDGFTHNELVSHKGRLRLTASTC